MRVLREMELAGLEARHRAAARDLRRGSRPRPTRSSARSSSCAARSSRSARPSSSRRSCSASSGCRASAAARPATRPTRACSRRSAHEHPVIPKIERWRELTKLAQTYLDALPLLIARRRPDPHHVQPDRRDHRPAVVEQPEPPEHPDPDRARARDPRLLRRRARQPARLGRLLAGRAAAARAHRRRGRAQGDLPKGRGCPHRDGLPRVWGHAGADRSRHAIEGEDDQLRHRLRAVGVGDGRPARHPPGGGRRVHPALHGRVPGGGAVHRGDDRAGHRARLRLDAVRPPPPGARAAGAPLGAAQAGRAVRGQHGDPGHRGGHHEGRDGPLRPRARARPGCARG